MLPFLLSLSPSFCSNWHMGSFVPNQSWVYWAGFVYWAENRAFLMVPQGCYFLGNMLKWVSQRTVLKAWSPAEQQHHVPRTSEMSIFRPQHGPPVPETLREEEAQQYICCLNKPPGEFWYPQKPVNQYSKL